LSRHAPEKLSRYETAGLMMVTHRARGRRCLRRQCASLPKRRPAAPVSRVPATNEVRTPFEGSRRASEPSPVLATLLRSRPGIAAPALQNAPRRRRLRRRVPRNV